MSRRRILAVASAGGHWIQLQRLRPAFEDQQVAFVTTNSGYRDEARPHRFYVVNDASRWNKTRLALMAVRLFLIVLRERPDVVISTGAACGYFAVRFGKLIGARTLWIDSIANIDEMSMAGRLARKYADLWLTQWPHLATPEGPHYAGAVL
jgi:UDP-N-acetylglucosamine:LPS N-acetylglucosamine transferase